MCDLLVSRLSRHVLQYLEHGDSAELDTAVIVVLERCTNELPNDHPQLAALLWELADLTQARYDESGDLADLDSSIRARQRALAVSPDTDPGLPCELSNLGVVLLTRYRRAGDPDDLEQSVLAARAAVSRTPSDHPHRASHLRRLARAVHVRFTSTGEDSDINEILTTLSTVADHPDRRADDLFTLGTLSHARYGTTSRVPDLDRAINAWERWLTMAVADHPRRKDVLSDLVRAHQERFHRSADRSDLNAAVNVARLAVETTLRTDLHWPCQLTLLGNALLDRHGEVGSANDLDEAITTLLASVEAAAADHPDRPVMSIALTRAAKARYHYYGGVKDLDLAVHAAEHTLRTCPTDNPNHVAIRYYLSDALWTRHEHRDDPADLDTAIEYMRHVAAELTDKRELAVTRSHLGMLLRSRYRLSGDIADLDAALTIGAQAEHGLAAGDSYRGQFMLHRGAVLRDKYAHSHQEADFAAAVMAFRTTAESRAAGAGDRERAARECGALLAEHRNWLDAHTVYTIAVTALPLLSWRGLDRASQERQLAGRTSSARDAAACATAAGQPSRAIEAVEYGRSVLWGQTLDTRTDLTALAAVDPSRARRLAEIRTALNGPQFGDGHDATGRGFPDDSGRSKRRSTPLGHCGHQSVT